MALPLTRCALIRSGDNIPNNPAKGFLLSLEGAFLNSTNFITAKHGLKGFDPETFSLVWTAAAAVYALGFVLVFGCKRHLMLPNHTIGRVVGLGFTGGLGMLLLWAGLAQLDPALASFLMRLSPVLTILLGGIVLGERLSVKELPPAGLIVLGSILSAVNEWHVASARNGVILTLLASLSLAVQSVLARTVADDVHPTVLTFYRVGIGALVIMFWVLVRGTVKFDVAPSHWVFTLLGALLGPCLSFILTYRAYRHWDLSRATLVFMSQPIFVLIMAYVAFGTLPTGEQLIGGCVILGGAVWFVYVHFTRRGNRTQAYP